MLDLVAGVQSTALYPMSLGGELVQKLDFAIFADTQEEPESIQCTAEEKIDVCEKIIRRQFVGLEPRQRTTKGVKVIQDFGLRLRRDGEGRLRSLPQGA